MPEAPYSVCHIMASAAMWIATTAAMRSHWATEGGMEVTAA